MLTTSQLQLLNVLVDQLSVQEDKLPEKFQADLEELQKNSLVVVEEGIIYTTSKAQLIITAAKSQLRFNSFIPQMNFRTFTNLIHRCIEHAAKGKFHLNVVLKNLNEKEFQYVVQQVAEAKQKREENV
jgi:hypothetical protein